MASHEAAFLVAWIARLAGQDMLCARPPATEGNMQRKAGMWEPLPAWINRTENILNTYSYNKQ